VIPTAPSVAEVKNECSCTAAPSACRMTTDTAVHRSAYICSNCLLNRNAQYAFGFLHV